MNHVPYVIALYIRLSTEDEKVGSLSIENQKYALHQYVESVADFDGAEVQEFTDNGFSGTSFERPAVQRLLALAQKGAVNCIIVKDFSRFGRNSTEVEYYLERVFPLYNIRFIALNDGYDSTQLRGDTGGINVAFKYLLNELYSRDLSIKYKNAKFTKFRRGEYQSRICPFGYRKSNDGRMEPDEEAANTVQLIFTLAQQGLGAKQIVKALYDRNIPTPAEYKAAHGFTGHDISRCHGIWHESTVARILADERYTGMYIIAKREVTEVGGHRARLKPEDQWVKIPDHHSAIVSKELYDQVQALRPHTKCAKKNINVYPLRSKVFCGCCRHAMPRTSNKNHAYICRHSQIDGATPCHGLRISEVELERTLYNMLLVRLQTLATSENCVSTSASEDVNQKIETCKEEKRELYEQFVMQKINLENYKIQQAKLDSELEQFKQTLAIVNTQVAGQKDAADWASLLQQLQTENHLTVELVDALVDRVDIYTGRVEPIWR